MRFKALRNLLMKPGLAVVKAVRQGVGRVQDSIGYIRHGPGYMLYGPTAGHATGKLSNGRSGRAYITEPVRNKGMPVQTLPLDEQRHVDILHTLPTHHEVEEHEPIMQNRDEVEATSRDEDEEPGGDFDRVKKGTRSGWRTEYEYLPAGSRQDVKYNPFIKGVYAHILHDIKTHIAKENNVKFQMTALVNTDKREQWVADTCIAVNKHTTNLEQLLQESMHVGLAEAVEIGQSGDELSGISAVAVVLIKNPSRRGGSFIPTPKGVKGKHGYVNVDNSKEVGDQPDNFCFKYAVCAALFRHQLPAKKRIRMDCLTNPKTWRPFMQKLDWSGISYPSSLQDVDRFEENNQDVAIHVWGMEEEDDGSGYIEVVRLSKTRDRPRTVYLLLLSDPVAESHHFTTIMNIGAFRRGDREKKCKKWPCNKCTRLMNSEKLLKQHIARGCDAECTGAIPVMPSMNKPIRHEDCANKKSRHHQNWIASDFEAYLQNVNEAGEAQRACPKNAQKVHEVLSYSFLQLIWTEKNGNEIFKRVLKVRAEGQSQHEFVKQYMDDIKQTTFEVYRYFIQNEPLNLTKEEQEGIMSAKKCCICNKAFKNRKDPRDRHHEHPTGLYLGPAHPQCNLLRHDWHFDNPVFFHNLKGYDAKHILYGCGKELDNNDPECMTLDELFDGEVNTIAESSEKLKVIAWKPRFSKEQQDGRRPPQITVTFKDSMAFIPGSLAKAVESLCASDQRRLKLRQATLFQNLKDYVMTLPLADKRPHTVKNAMELLKRKGVFCYDFVDSIKALSIDHLPPQEAFDNMLTGEKCCDDDYKHASLVWATFDCRTLLDYHNIYLPTDVALLADVFENFRQICRKYYKLDPCAYISGPQMFWDCMLKMTGVALDQLVDKGMYELFERGKRGGSTFLAEMWAKANNKYIEGSDLSTDAVHNFLCYLDSNNLYGWAMCQALPEKDFAWVADHKLGNLPCENVEQNDKKGYTLEVDMYLPREHHRALVDFPPLAERRLIPEKELSPYDAHMIKRADGWDKFQVDKDRKDLLINHLKPVERYVVSHYMLQLLMQLGYKVTKVHRAVSYTQRAWMKPYIDFNTEMRRKAKNAGDELMADFFKLCNVSNFGKTIENVRNYGSSKFAYNQKSCFKLFTSPAYKSSTHINENLCLVHLHKQKIELNKPIYVGQTILDISKMYMADFYHNKLKKFYGDRVRLMYSDTDSLVLNIQTEDVFEDLKGEHLKQCFDFHGSKHNTSNVEYMTPGPFKFEFGPDQHVKEWCGVTIKVYGVEMAEMPADYAFKYKPYKTTSKGFKMPNTKGSLDLYRKAIFEHQHQKVKVNSIRSTKQKLFTIQQEKIGANPGFGGKRFALEPDHENHRYSSVPFGYNPL